MNNLEYNAKLEDPLSKNVKAILSSFVNDDLIKLKESNKTKVDGMIIKIS